MVIVSTQVWGTVTLGGVILGVGLIILRVGVWLPPLKALRSAPLGHLGDLLPFVFSWCFGALLIMCAGGIVGWAADVVLWGGNWVGDGTLMLGVGGQAGENVTRRGPQQALTNGGHAVVLLLCFVVAVLLKRGRVDRGHVWQGTCSGVLLGLSGSVLGQAAVPLASVVNLAGALISTEVLR